MTFHISNPGTSIELKDGSGHVQFTVSNTRDEGVRARASVAHLEGAQDTWLSVAGDPERVMEAGGTTVFSVNVKVPEGTPKGRHKLRLDVVNAANSQEDFKQGPEVSFEIPGDGTDRKIWPWVLGGVGALLLLIGGIFLLVRMLGGSIAVPDVTGMEFEEAKLSIEELGLVVESTEVVQGAPENEVLEQEPEAGAEVEKKSVVALVHEAPFVTIPDLTDADYQEVEVLLNEMGLVVASRELRRVDPNRPGKVISLEPASGENVRKGTPVVVTVEAPLCTVPNVLGRPIAEALAMLEEVGLDFTLTTQTVDPSKGGQVVSQSLAGDLRVQEGATVQLVAEAGRIAAPNVVSLAKQRAREQIEGAGLKFALGGTIALEGSSVGTIGRQVPAAETLLTEEAVVTVFPVGKGVKIPSVVGRTKASAVQALKNAGLKVRVQSQFDKARSGKVIRQDVLGAYVLQGSEVTVWIGTDKLVVHPGLIKIPPVELIKGPVGRLKMSTVHRATAGSTKPSGTTRDR